MSEVYECPAGHHWQPFDEPLDGRPDPFLCPECGAGPLSEAAAALRRRVKLNWRRLAFAGVVTLLAVALGYGAYFLTRARPVLTLHPCEGRPVFGVAFSPDGSQLLTGGEDDKLRLWEVPTGRKRLEVPAHNGTVSCVAFAPNGDRLVSGGTDGRVAVWNAQTGAEVGSFFQPLCRAVAVSPDSRLVASVGLNNTGVGGVRGGPDDWLIVWEMATRRERFRFRPPGECLWSVAYSPDGKRIALGEALNGVRLLDAETGRPIAFVPSAHMSGLAFSPDGKLLAAPGPGRFIQMLDAATGRVVAEFPTSHSHSLSCLAFSNDGKWLASGSGDSSHAGEVVISDAERGVELAAFRGHAKGVTAVAISRDGKYLATSGRDGTAKLWDLGQLIPRDR